MIVLDKWEMILGAHVGAIRQTLQVEKRAAQNHGADPNKNGFQRHVEGALAEMALAKFLDVYWRGVGEVRAPDVGEDDCRQTDLADGHLFIHENDSRKTWLVTGLNGKYEVRGWIMAEDGKRDEWYRAPQSGRFCWCVPQSALIRTKPAGKNHQLAFETPSPLLGANHGDEQPPAPSTVEGTMK